LLVVPISTTSLSALLGAYGSSDDDENLEKEEGEISDHDEEMTLAGTSRETASVAEEEPKPEVDEQPKGGETGETPKRTHKNHARRAKKKSNEAARVLQKVESIGVETIGMENIPKFIPSPRPKPNRVSIKPNLPRKFFVPPIRKSLLEKVGYSIRFAPNSRI
jgi:hypothetical protein